MYEGKNIIVLDLETLHSADDLPTGWNDRPALGLSIGGYWDYMAGRIVFFDRASLLETMIELAMRKPLMVSFNGIGFDYVLMRGLLRREFENDTDVTTICDTFKRLAAESYDILAEVWAADSAGKYERGLNSLDAICKANKLGEKTGRGEQAPKDWAAGKYADVINYLSQDIYLTKALLELIIQQDGTILRSTGPLTVRLPDDALLASS